MEEISKPKILTAQLEKIVFYLLILIMLFNIWRVPAFITMDGPAHLYNASLLNMYNDSGFLQQFLDFNHAFLPNFMSHWILKALLLCFDFFTAEKILVSIIVIFLPLTFRLLVKVMTNDIPYYSFIIFPLVFTNLLHFGFYNFCLGFVFINIHIYLTFYISKKKGDVLHWILLFSNSFLMYYCHLFGYGIAVFVCLIIIISVFWKKNKELFNAIGFFILIHLPTLIFGLIFSFKTKVLFFNYDLEPYEKSIALMTFSPGIIFEKKEELPYAVIITVLLIILIASSLTHRFIKEKRKITPNDFLLILAFLTIYLIFHSKDGDFGGMFIMRLMILTYYFLMIWIACNAVKNYITILSMVLVIFVCCHLWHSRNATINSMQNKVIDVEMAGNLIAEQSIVQTVVLSDIWFQGHLSGYLGINKEVVLLENYEAVLPWFPLSWNKRMQSLPEKENIKQFSQPDYIFIYGEEKKLSYRLNDSLNNYIRVNMVKIYESSDKFCRLFRQKNPRIKNN